MIRKVLAPFVAVLLTLILAAPASAHISHFDFDVIYVVYNDDSSGGTGDITCTAGETWRVTMRVAQKATGYRASGVDTGTCTGSEQTWSISNSTSGDADQARTRWVIVAKTFDSGVLHDKETIEYRSG